MDNPNLPKLREKANRLPLLPGVYIMKNAQKEIIYIGKAKYLKNRVSSYFRAVENHLPKVYKMVSNVENFEYIVTNSEFEALVLEASLIKQHQPKYNILLKDDKGYSYIKISGDDFPRITEEKQKEDDGGKYIGPYTSSFVTKETVEQVNKIFKLPTCGKKLCEGKAVGRPCLNYHINQCMGVCTGKISVSEYGEVIKQAKNFIKDGGTAAIENFEKKMNEAAENLHFERAAEYRDKINAIRKIREKQNVVEISEESQDVIALVKSSENTCATVINFREQRLTDKKDYLLGEIDDISTGMYEFMLSYYSGKNDIPSLILIEREIPDMDIMERYLTEKSGRRVTVSVPKRGEKTKLIEMAEANGAEKLSQIYKRTARELRALDMLGKLLGLKDPPQYIESYDISNFGDETIVAGMVVYKDGKPLKSGYRKFSMKTVTMRDDYASMREVIKRRFEEYFKEREMGTGFGKLPNLILLDGGRGHVNAVKPLIEEMGLDIPVFGMVKDSRHKTRAITNEGEEISIASYEGAYALVTAIQDEVHRFTIGYSRQKHSKNAFVSELCEIDGIGKKRAGEIMKHFKTNKALKEASPEKIAEVKGISKEMAQKIYDFLRESL